MDKIEIGGTDMKQIEIELDPYDVRRPPILQPIAQFTSRNTVTAFKMSCRHDIPEGVTVTYGNQISNGQTHGLALFVSARLLLTSLYG
jgi:hypothetical protein